jgi:DNA glycosylase AlkZ-like
MTPDRLDLRALNRATLARQLLLGRATMTALDAVGHLAGLQAQAPLAPYVGLWTRLAGFRHEDLKDLLTERAVLRAHLMRNTVHLVDAADYVRFRPLYQPLLARHLAGNFGKNLVGGATGGTLLVDGLWQADWKISQDVLEIRPFVRLDAADRDAIAAEGERLLGFAVPAKAVRDVRFAPVRSG